MKRVLIALLLSAGAMACPPPPMASAPAVGGVKFSLMSEPVAADISVDGAPRGLSPVTVSLTPGTHRVTMSKSGYFTLETAVEVTAGGSFTGTLVASH